MARFQVRRNCRSQPDSARHGAPDRVAGLARHKACPAVTRISFIGRTYFWALLRI